MQGEAGLRLMVKVIVAVIEPIAELRPDGAATLGAPQRGFLELVARCDRGFVRLGGRE